MTQNPGFDFNAGPDRVLYVCSLYVLIILVGFLWEHTVTLVRDSELHIVVHC